MSKRKLDSNANIIILVGMVADFEEFGPSTYLFIYLVFRNIIYLVGVNVKILYFEFIKKASNTFFFW